jgi:hypothetical protein
MVCQLGGGSHGRWHLALVRAEVCGGRQWVRELHGGGHPPLDLLTEREKQLRELSSVSYREKK